MSGDIKVFLAYATIPLYVVGLLVLIACIARYQLQLPIRQGIKRLLKPSTSHKERQQQPAYPPVAYLSLLVLSALLVVLTILSEKGKRS